MKAVRKDKILKKNQAEYLKDEKDILTKIVHPFIIHLIYSLEVRFLVLNLDSKI